MSLLKNKFFLPLCLAGILIGYGGSEWIAPRYFHPTSDTQFTPASIIAAIGTEPKYYRQTSSGNYLAGQFAQRHKDWSSAGRFMGNVLLTDPLNEDLQRHAMVLAMTSGNTDYAVKLAKEIKKTEKDNILAVLFIALNDFKNKNYTQAISTLDAISDDNSASFIIPILKLWAQTSSNVIDISELSPHSFYAYHAMLAGNYLDKNKDDILKYALEVYDSTEIDIRDIEKAADLFALLGKTEKSESLYNALSLKGFSNADIKEKISLLKDKKSILDKIKIQPITSPEQGAALVFHDMAELLVREYNDDSATIFAQMALHLNPDLEESRMIIGRILSRHDRLDDAIELYKNVGKKSLLYKMAQRHIADLYGEQDNYTDAIKILTSLHKTYDDAESLIQIGDLYRYQEDHKNAIRSYNKIIKAASDVPEKYWHVLYARGMSYERVKDFEKSEKDLQAALKFRPNHPDLLNYLGYSWADQGINLNKSLDMIKQAIQIKPNDGYIADSLGWVYYKMGDFSGSLPYLERAVELEPYDATMNDHLGDAYWHAGRKLEARFQWRRAVNYSKKSEADLKEKIKQKIITGLMTSSKKKTDKVMGAKIDAHTKQSSL